MFHTSSLDSPSSRLTRRKLLKWGLGLTTGVGISHIRQPLSVKALPASIDNVIRVGILHSLSGALAFDETVLVDAERLAISQINAAGGILGRPIQTFIEDGATKWPVFREKAEKLITHDRVDVVFGCYTSASRKSVLPVFESRDHMLWYPLHYEGQECSRNIFYTGATPNQQTDFAVDWLLSHRGNRFFLVGSDYVFPRTINGSIKSQLRDRNGMVIGEDYLPLGSTNLLPIVRKIQALMPDGGVIFNSLVGNNATAFFRQLKAAGLEADRYPVMSVNLTEENVREIGVEFLMGHYAAWNYFQTVDSPVNQRWISEFRAEYGNDRVVTDPMEAAYTMVYLWKQAVEAAGTTHIPAVRQAAYGQTLMAPSGRVTLNTNHHLSKTVRVGQVRQDGLFDIVATSDGPIDPIPWNPHWPSSQGYGCDWSDPAKGGRYVR